jgi:RHS repeat-associated protein
MERDEETGLNYHNARYYINWLGRWMNPDPIGIGDGVNVYAYCRNNPVTYLDTEGTQINVGSVSTTGTTITYQNVQASELIKQTEEKAKSEKQAELQRLMMTASTKTSEVRGMTYMEKQRFKAVIKYEKFLDSKNPFDQIYAQRQIHFETYGYDPWVDIYYKSQALSQFYVPKGEGIRPVEVKLNSNGLFYKPVATEQIFKPSDSGPGSGKGKATPLYNGEFTENPIKFEPVNGPQQPPPIPKVALDANALIMGLEKGQLNAIDNAVNGRIPIISITAAKEYLQKGDVNILREFLTTRGGNVGKAATEEQIKGLQDQATAIGRVLRYKDAAVVGSAVQENAELITNDKKLLNFLNAVGIPARSY